ncbi:MAG: glutamine-hydrolyzing carbamoyl-phosphate synthase small subunit [Nitrososphaerales archaeon]
MLLEDGEVFEGNSFGYVSATPRVGEVVFNTGMVGYTEAMTDPSYSGQLLCFTYPLLGNYGVPDYVNDEHCILKNFESEKIQVKGVIANQVSMYPSHFESTKSLSKWMDQEKIPGIEGLDTRELTIHLREQGVMMGVFAKTIEEGKSALAKAQGYSETNFYEIVGTKAKRTFGKKVNGRIALIDCGVKLNIVRCLVLRGFEVSIFPYNLKMNELVSEGKFDGVVFSNGPGDPKICGPAIELSRQVIDENIPTLGICLGTQIIALSQGADTFKLKYGHRGQNKPCIDLKTGRCLVTSQNHGYSVKKDSLPGTKLTPWFENADDHTIEGLIHETKPCLSVQFHPEASPGPVDASYVFDAFADRITKNA